jgi:predicted GH43/DUF377 family glycosyl hydrolase
MPHRLIYARERFAPFVLAVWLGLPAMLQAAEPVTVDLKSGDAKGVSLDRQGRLRLTQNEQGYASAGEFTSASVDLGQAGTAKLNWIEQWTTPQKWTRYAKNPIYGPKQSGAWDDWTNGVSIVRNPDNKSYKMFYAGRAGAGIGFAEASITDPITWKENAASPVLKPLKNWEGNSINQPRVVKVTDDHWRMYYTGWGYKHPNGGSPWAFNLAESFDAGVSWKRHDEGPMLERGDVDSPDGGGVFVPEVRRIGDTWMMWYTAMKVAAGQRIQICLATSPDGIHWTKHPENPVLTDDYTTGPARNVISRCFVRHAEGVFSMWYSHAKPDYRIKYAESLDGVHWEHSPISPVLDAGPKGAWDSQMVEYPEVDLVNGQWRLWFCGNGFGTVGFATGEVETHIETVYRTGTTATPDDKWTPWQRATRGESLDLQQYVQVRAKFTSDNRQLSPAMSKLEVVRKE